MHKVVKGLITALSVIAFMAVVVGFYMFLQYIDKNVKMALIFLGVTLVGIGILATEIFIFVKRRKREAIKDEEEDEIDQ